jgi:hypothetical protein
MGVCTGAGWNSETRTQNPYPLTYPCPILLAYWLLRSALCGQGQCQNVRHADVFYCHGGMLKAMGDLVAHLPVLYIIILQCIANETLDGTVIGQKQPMMGDSTLTLRYPGKTRTRSKRVLRLVLIIATTVVKMIEKLFVRKVLDATRWRTQNCSTYSDQICIEV